MQRLGLRLVLGFVCLLALALVAFCAWTVAAQNDLAQARLRYAQEVGPAPTTRHDTEAGRSSAPETEASKLWREAGASLRAAASDKPAERWPRARADELAAGAGQSDPSAGGENVRERVRAVVAKHRETVDRIVAATTDAAPHPIDLTTPNPSRDTGPLLDHLQLTRLLRFAAYERLASTETTAACAVAHSLGLATQVADNMPHLPAAMIAVQAHAVRLDVVRTLVEAPDIAPACLETLARSLAATPPPHAIDLLATEGASVLEQTREQADRHRLWRWFPGGAAHTETVLLDRWRHLASVANAPYSQMEDQLASVERGRRDSMGAILADMLVPNLFDILRKLRRVEIAHQLARQATAHRRAQRTGAETTVAGATTQGTVIASRQDQDGSTVIEAQDILASLEDTHENDRTADQRLFRWPI